MRQHGGCDQGEVKDETLRGGNVDSTGELRVTEHRVNMDNQVLKGTCGER